MVICWKNKKTIKAAKTTRHHVLDRRKKKGSAQLFSLNEKLSTQLKMKYHKPLQKKKKQHTLITLIITLHHQIITMLIYCLLSAMTEDFLSNVQSFFSSSASQESEGSGLG